MITQKDKTKAINLVKDFIIQMNSWEKFCNKIEEDDNLTFKQQDSQQKDELVKIFGQFCTKQEQKNGKPTTISYGLTGSYRYDFDEEKIIDAVQEDLKKIAVNTAREKPMPERFAYTIVREGQTLLIDSKKRKSSWEKKWKVVSL